MTVLKISSYIISHDYSIMFTAHNHNKNFDDNRIQETNKEFANEIYQLMENDLFFNFMKPEDSIYETGKAIHFSLQATNNEENFKELKNDETRYNQHIIDIDIKNYNYDTFQIAEDYEFSADKSNIIHIDKPSQKENITISIYADKKEEASSVTVIILY